MCWPNLSVLKMGLSALMAPELDDVDADDEAADLNDCLGLAAAGWMVMSLSDTALGMVQLKGAV